MEYVPASSAWVEPDLCGELVGVYRLGLLVVECSRDSGSGTGELASEWEV